MYADYEDEDEPGRKRLTGTELFGYVMAMRLRERLVDVRQVLNLYKDFDRASGCKYSISLVSPPEALSPKRMEALF